MDTTSFTWKASKAATTFHAQVNGARSMSSTVLLHPHSDFTIADGDFIKFIGSGLTSHVSGITSQESLTIFHSRDQVDNETAIITPASGLDEKWDIAMSSPGDNSYEQGGTLRLISCDIRERPPLTASRLWDNKHRVKESSYGKPFVALHLPQTISSGHNATFTETGGEAHDHIYLPVNHEEVLVTETEGSTMGYAAALKGYDPPTKLDLNLPLAQFTNPFRMRLLDMDTGAVLTGNEISTFFIHGLIMGDKHR